MAADGLHSNLVFPGRQLPSMRPEDGGSLAHTQAVAQVARLAGQL